MTDNTIWPTWFGKDDIAGWMENAKLETEIIMDAGVLSNQVVGRVPGIKGYLFCAYQCNYTTTLLKWRSDIFIQDNHLLCIDNNQHSDAPVRNLKLFFELVEEYKRKSNS